MLQPETTAALPSHQFRTLNSAGEDFARHPAVNEIATVQLDPGTGFYTIAARNEIDNRTVMSCLEFHVGAGSIQLRVEDEVA